MPFDTPSTNTSLNCDYYEHPVMQVPLSEVLGEGVTDTRGQTAVIVGDKIVKVHGRRYKLIPHIDVMQSISNGIIDAGLGHDLTVSDQMFENQAKARRTIIFDKKVIEPAVNDKLKLKLDIFNSYDGDWSVIFKFYWHRLWCLNGCAVWDTMMTYSSRHTSIPSPNRIQETVRNVLDRMDSDEATFARWCNTRVNPEQARDLFNKTIAKKAVKGETDEERLVTHKLSDKLMGYFETEPLSLWGVYNAATAWATHEETRGKAHMTTVRRNNLVSQMINTSHFKALEAA